MDHHSERVLDLNIQGTTAMYVLISSLTTANCAAVQIPKAGGCCSPTSSEQARRDICHGSAGSRGTWSGGLCQAQSRREAGGSLALEASDLF